MKDKSEIIMDLTIGLINADGDNVVISRADTEWLLKYLRSQKAEPIPEPVKENCQLFYCDHCGKSFWYPGVEDSKIRQEFGYSVWYANCPTCKEEIRLTDHYWR